MADPTSTSKGTISGPTAFATGLRRASGAFLCLVVLTLLHVVMVRAILGLPIELISRPLGEGLLGTRLRGPTDLSLVVEGAVVHGRELAGWAATAPGLLLLGALVTIFAEAAVLERIRLGHPLGMERIFAAAGRKGLAFVRATLSGGVVLAGGFALVAAGERAARKLLDLETHPSELLSYRVELGALAGNLLVLLAAKTFLDLLKARVISEEAGRVPPGAPGARPAWRTGPSVVRLSLATARQLVTSPLAPLSVTLLNGVLFVGLFMVLGPVLSLPAGVLPVAALLHGLLLTWARFSFLAGQLSLVESLAAVPAPAPVLAPAAAAPAAPAPPPPEAAPAAPPAAVPGEASAPIAAPAVSHSPTTADAAAATPPTAAPPAAAPPPGEVAAPTLAPGEPAAAPTEAPAAAAAAALAAAATETAPVDSAAAASLVEAAAAPKLDGDLSFLESLPDYLPDRRERRPEPIVAPAATEAAAPAAPVAEPAPAPVPPAAPAAAPDVVFVMEEEADSGRYPVVTREVVPDAAPVPDLSLPPPEEAAKAIAPTAEERESSTLILSKDRIAAALSGARDAAAARREPEMELPAEAAGVSLEVERTEPAVPIAPATAPATPPRGAPERRVTAGDLFGDILRDLGAEMKEPAKPAPPPPPPPRPAFPANEPKLTVKDIFGDILEEIGGELPESAREKPKDAPKEPPAPPKDEPGGEKA